jgi:hypothetical protein
VNTTRRRWSKTPLQPPRKMTNRNLRQSAFTPEPGRHRRDPSVGQPDDGIRTRDPHLDKVIVFVHGVQPSLLDCDSVQPVSSESARDPPCCRPVYFEWPQVDYHRSLQCPRGRRRASPQLSITAQLGKAARWLSLDRTSSHAGSVISTPSSAECQRRFTMAPRRRAPGLWRLAPFVRRK